MIEIKKMTIMIDTTNMVVLINRFCSSLIMQNPRSPYSQESEYPIFRLDIISAFEPIAARCFRSPER